MNETTDEHRSAPLSWKSFAICQGFLCVLLRAQASCVRELETLRTPEAGSVRSKELPPRSARLCGEAFWLCLGRSVFIW